MLKAIILDLNGIFLQSPKLSKRFEQDFNIKEEVFLPALFEIMEKVRKPGALPAFTYWQPYLEKWDLSLSEKDFWDYWFGAEMPSEKMINFARSLKEKGIKVIILSNNFKERAEYYGSYPWIHDAVDKVYFSWQTGFVKPDIQAWEFVLTDNNLKVEECIYFDDQQKNLDASEKVGIRAYMFTNEKELEEIVNKNLE
ncbi:MAG: HAD-IA family hydrolase [bacterium]|nr:HAD-IA family hydrolase [bacterium]